MQLDDEQLRILRRLRKAPADFATLVKLAGLDPRRDFRGASLRGVDFGRADVSGFDFTDADLSDADLRRARVGRALEAAASLEGARLPEAEPERPLSPRPELRPYQRAAIEAVVERFGSGRRSAVVTMPHGLGRTTLIGEMIEAFKARHELTRALILVDRKALVNQIIHSFRKMYPNISVGLFPGRKDWSRHDVSVANVMHGYVPNMQNVDLINQLVHGGDHFSHIFIDEIYKSSPYVARYALNSPSKVIAFSSGPLLDDKQGSLMGSIFKGAPVFRYDLGCAIRDGYVAPIELSQCWLRYSDSPGRAIWPTPVDGVEGMGGILAEEMDRRNMAMRDGLSFSTALIFDTGAPAAQIFSFMANEVRPKVSSGEAVSGVYLYRKKDRGDLSHNNISHVIVCEADQVDEYLLNRCDRLVIFGHRIPKLLPATWLSSAAPFHRSIADYVGNCADAFRAMRPEQFAEVVDLVADLSNPHRPAWRYSAA